MAWTPDLIKELKRLWNKGLTTVEIGNRIGMSKNAVVGKAHRLGLEGRPSPIKRDKKKEHVVAAPTSKKAPIAKKEKVTATSSILPPEPAFEPEPIVEKAVSKKKKHKGVQLVDLKPNSCRWPEGDPKDPDFCFCGQECAPGKIYCEEHCAIAYSGVFKAK